MKVGDELQVQNETFARLVDSAGDQLRRLAEHIRQRSAGDLVNDVTAFGRRRPVVFVGGAFLVGLGLSRFLKSAHHPYDMAEADSVRPIMKEEARHDIAY
jgi:hypothetical protein